MSGNTLLSLVNTPNTLLSLASNCNVLCRLCRFRRCVLAGLRGDADTSQVSHQ